MATSGNPSPYIPLSQEEFEPEDKQEKHEQAPPVAAAQQAFVSHPAQQVCSFHNITLLYPQLS